MKQIRRSIDATVHDDSDVINKNSKQTDQYLF